MNDLGELPAEQRERAPDIDDPDRLVKLVENEDVVPQHGRQRNGNSRRRANGRVMAVRMMCVSVTHKETLFF
jgi:hypothetical protein